MVLKHHVFDNWQKKKKGENCFVLLGKACIDDSTSLHPADVITLLTTGVLCRGLILFTFGINIHLLNTGLNRLHIFFHCFVYCDPKQVVARENFCE